MAGEPEIQFFTLPRPVRCVLWRGPDLLSRGFIEHVDQLEIFVQKSHEARYLWRCPECGQLYVYDWLSGSTGTTATTGSIRRCFRSRPRKRSRP